MTSTMVPARPNLFSDGDQPETVVPDHLRKPVSLGLLLIFLLGLSLRIYCLDCTSLWFDEVTSISYYAHDWAQVLGSFTFLYHFLIWLPSQFVDPASTAFFVRLPSALAGAFTPLVLYAVGRELFGWRQGLVAAVLTAVAAQLLRYSQEARPYAVLTLLAVIGVYCLIRLARTHSWRWWWGFVASCAAAVAYSNTGLTILMPTLSVCALWMLLSAGIIDLRRRAHLVYSVAVLLGGAGVLLLLVSRLGRELPDITRFSINDLTGHSVSALLFYGRLDAGEGLSRVFQTGLMLLATYGAYVGIKKGAQFGVYTCVLLILVPFALLALFSTQHSVFERYVLFAISFYFLLVSNGLVGLLSFGLLHASKRPYRYVLRAGALMAVGLVALLFLLSSYYYSTPGGRGSLSDRPDFRGAANYLAEHVGPDDVILFVGDDSTTADFYWKYKPPARSYSALDPRLFRQKGTGAIYWVSVYGTSKEAMDDTYDFVPFDGVLVIRDGRRVDEITQAYDSFITLIPLLGEKHIPSGWLNIYRGSVQQARGEVDSAAKSYLLAGTAQSYGDQYIELAKSYEAGLEHDKAWWATLISKWMHAGNPRLHTWLAELLVKDGYHDESRIEQAVANNLEDAMRDLASPDGDSP